MTIQIHLMLFFIQTIGGELENIKYSNTSHVILYRNL